MKIEVVNFLKREIEVAEYVKSRNAHFISTPFSIPAIERVVNLGVPFIKIGSGEFNNLPLIREACSSKTSFSLSTGMNTLNSIDKTVEEIGKFGNSFALMHCTNLYPLQIIVSDLMLLMRCEKDILK